MQKLITLTINIEKLQEGSKGPFTITEVEEVNELLQQGWALEEWEFITGEKESDKAVMMLVLNDDDTEGDYLDDDFDFANVDEGEDEDGEGEERDENIKDTDEEGEETEEEHHAS